MDIHMNQKHSERAAAFPILISLAILCMLQPRGRVLGGRSRYRTFLRTSPFICLLDSVDILLLWFLTSTYLRCKPLMALKIIGHDRFKGSEPSFGIEKIRANVLLRLLYVVLVILPALRMLWSFDFTPMAQIYAGVFMISYVIDELVSGFVPPDDFFKLRMRKFTSLANYAECLTVQDEARVTRFRETLLFLAILESVAGVLIVVGQCVFFVWLCFAYDCFWDMDNTGDVIRLCARKAPLVILLVMTILLFVPITDSILLKFPRAGRTLQLVYPKTPRQPGEIEVDREAKLWFVFLFVNLLSAGVGYRAFLMKVPYH